MILICMFSFKYLSFQLYVFIGQKYNLIEPLQAFSPYLSVIVRFVLSFKIKENMEHYFVTYLHCLHIKDYVHAKKQKIPFQKFQKYA